MEATGATAYNAGLPGVAPEILDGWVRQATPLADPELVVWGIAPLLFEAESRDPQSCAGRDADWNEPSALRTAVFGGVDVLADVSIPSMSFGDPYTNEPPDAIGPLHGYYRATFTEFGGRQHWPRLSEDELQQALDRFSRHHAGYFVCAERMQRWVGTLEWLDAEGVDVVVVAMPLSDLHVGAFPGGPKQVAKVLARAEKEAAAAGVEFFLDLSKMLPDERFRDLFHLDKLGAEKYTTRVVNELVKRGFLDPS